MLTEKQLRQILPQCEDPAGWIKPLNAAMQRFGIDAAPFLAQIAVESSSLNRVEENLRYSAARIAQVWPSRFPKGEKEAQLYAWNPTKLANRVYANRNGNGDEASGDGYRFRGRGLLQITGRSNYARIGKALGLDLIQFADALLERKYAALSAGAFWFESVGRAKNPAGDMKNIEAVTKVITGGKTALEERKAFLKRAQEVLGGERTSGSVGDQKNQKAGPDNPPRVAGTASRAKVPTATEEWFN